MSTLNTKKGEIYSLRKVLKGASMYSLGDILVKASGFFLIPIYTRILTPTEYGIVGYLEVFSQILIVILGFGFHGAQTRYYFEHHEDDELVGRFMFTINITTIVAFIFLLLPLLVVGYLRGWTIGNEKIAFHPYVSITLIIVLLSVLNNNMTSSLRMQQKIFSTSLVQIFTFLLTTSATIFLVVRLKLGAYGRITGNAFGLAIIFLTCYIFIYAKEFKLKFSKIALKYAVEFGFPIVIHLLMGTIHSFIDRLMLEHYMPISELGIYTLGASLANVLRIVISGFDQAYQPSYYELMNSKQTNKEEKITQTFTIYLSLITAITCIGLLLGGPFLRIFAGRSFIRVINIFPYLLVAAYFSSYCNFFASPIFYFKKTSLLPYISGSSAIVNILLNLILIPLYGIIGSALATCISHVWISLYYYFIGNKLFKVRWPWKYIGFSNLIVILSLLLSVKVIN